MDIRWTLRENLSSKRSGNKGIFDIKMTQRCTKNLDELDTESLQGRGRAKFRPPDTKKRTSSHSQEPDEGKGEFSGHSGKERCRSLDKKERKRGGRARRSLQSVMSVIFMVTVGAKAD